MVACSAESSYNTFAMTTMRFALSLLGMYQPPLAPNLQLPPPGRVIPPPGMVLSDTDRSELMAGVESLGKKLESL